jgi:hypothetical protein
MTLQKVLLNTHGGTATLSNFPLTATGPVTISGLNGAASVTNASVRAGTYTLTEPAVYGYKLVSLVCDTGQSPGTNTVTLTVGQSATCVYTNQDVGATIVVQKNADPASGNFAFTTTGSGYTNFNLAGGPITGQKNTQTGLAAGTYTVRESTQLGWTLTAIGGNSDPNFPNTCQVTGSGGSTSSTDAAGTQTATINLKNGDTVSCLFENTGNGATRTQGFWATHSQLANIAWFGGSAYGHTFPGVTTVAGDITLCGRSIDTLGKVEGGFWSGVSNTSTGGKRSALDQGRMQLLQQLLAAELNASAFGSSPGSGSFSAWEAAYCGTDTKAISTAQQQAAAFNSKGDSSTFTPGTAADSKTARAIANYVFWDILP